VSAGAVRERAASRGREVGHWREYLYVDQLVELTPWSAGRIRNMIADGTFEEGVHYFRPNGVGSRPIFKLSAVVEFIEGKRQPDARVAAALVEVLDEDTRKARALLS
jgi:hypothetical protein